MLQRSWKCSLPLVSAELFFEQILFPHFYILQISFPMSRVVRLYSTVCKSEHANVEAERQKVVGWKALPTFIAFYTWCKFTALASASAVDKTLSQIDFHIMTESLCVKNSIEIDF